MSIRRLRHALRAPSRNGVALIVLGSIAGYSTVMLALALFVLHPTALGWIGLGVATVAALLAGTMLVLAFGHTRTNAVRLHPRPGAVYRLVVVADTDVEPAQLLSAVRLRVIGRPAEVRVVTPVMTTPLRFLAAAEEGDRADAARRLAMTLILLRRVGIKAQGVIGTDDPLQAVGDVLADFPADELLLIGTLPARRSWLDQDFEREARDRFGVPVATVFGRQELALHEADC